MKRLKFPVFFAALALAVVSAFAFNVKPQAVKLTTSYHYIGIYTDAEVAKPVNWIEETTDCPSEGNLPCEIETPLDRTNFDVMVQGFTNVADAKDASTKRLYE